MARQSIPRPDLRCAGSCLYIQLAPYAEWNAYHATGAEIKRYFDTVAQDYNLAPFIQFHTEVTHCQFDEATQQWHIDLSTGARDCVDMIIYCGGVAPPQNA